MIPSLGWPFGASETSIARSSDAQYGTGFRVEGLRFRV